MDYRYRLLLRRFLLEGDVDVAVEIANIAARTHSPAETDTLWVMQVGDSTGTGTNQQSVYLYSSQELALESAVMLARHILDTAWAFGPNPAWGAQFIAAVNRKDYPRAMELYTANYPQSPIWVYEEYIDED
jgi:hypothetical protein